MFRQDLDIFFAEFGAVVVKDGTDLELCGIFDNAFLQQVGFESRDPQLLMRDTDVATWQQQQLITVNGARYRVARREPDGTGLTLLQLRIA